MSPATAYHASPGLSWSRLRTRAESELAFSAYDPGDSDTFRVGRALHSLVLGGDRVVACPMRRDTRTAAYRDWLEEHAGCIVLTEAQHATVLTLAEAVMSSRLARAVLDPLTAREAVIRWTERGRACRGMVDGYDIAPAPLRRGEPAPRARVVEVKTARDPSPARFASQVAALRYHGQLAWYERGLAASLGVVPDEHVWIVVGTTHPHDVCVYRATPERRASGHALVETLLDALDADDARHAADPDAPVWGATPEVAELDVTPWERAGMGLMVGGEALDAE